ncbi:MAG: OmpA family protein [Holophagaceae bacterium]|nr:OmpA family protein [Holophagaceae bacterium]
MRRSLLPAASLVTVASLVPAASLAVVLLGLAAGCKKPAPAPVLPMTVRIRTEPSRASVSYKGQTLGPAPQDLRLAAGEDLLGLDASRENDPLVEKRIRFLSEDDAEVVFIFQSGRSAMAKALGLPRILVFDYGSNVSFDVDKFDLKPAFLPFLDRQAAMLNKHFPGLPVHVCGHTDSTGNADHNLKLSLDRAQGVAEGLAARGVDKGRLKVQGLGSAYPLAGNDTPDERTMNRRTELILPQ